MKLKLNQLKLEEITPKIIIDNLFLLFKDEGSDSHTVEIRFPNDRMLDLYFDCIFELEKRMGWQDAGVISKHEKEHYREVVRCSEISFHKFDQKHIYLAEFPGMLGLRLVDNKPYPMFAIIHGGSYPEDVMDMNISDQEKRDINLFVFKARLRIDLAPKDNQVDQNDMNSVLETLNEAHELGMLLDWNIENIKEQDILF